MSRAVEAEGASLSTAIAGQWRSVMAWAFVLGLWLVQWGLFREHVEREVVWAYPRCFDQVAYLSKAYDTHSLMSTQGVYRGLRHSLAEETPTGVLFPVQAAFLFLVLGPGRLSALTLNFLYFIGFQAALIATLRWASGRWSIAFLGLGLLLCSSSPLLMAGGLTDFRLDFAAFCAFGVVVCLALRSDMFYSRRWSLAVGAAIGVLVLLRFISAVYLCGMFVVFLGSLTVDLLWRRRDPAVVARRKRQLANLLGALVVTMAVAVPGLFYNRHAIVQYYGMHFDSSESQIRLREFGATSLNERLLYYPRSILRDHVGRNLSRAAAAVCAASVGFWFWMRRRGRPSVAGGGISFGEIAWLLAVSFCVPLLIFTAHGIPSPVVANICLAPLIIALALMLARAVGACGTSTVPRGAKLALNALTTACLIFSLYCYADRISRRGWMADHRADAEQVAAAYDCMGKFCGKTRLHAPRILSDRLNEYSLPDLLRPLWYECHQETILPMSTFGCHLDAVDEPQTRQALAQSDIVMLTASTNDESGSPYPFDRSMVALQPCLLEYCQSEMQPLGRFHYFDRDVTVFGRPRVVVDGVSADGWIQNRGFVLRIPGRWLAAHPVIELAGDSETRWFGGATNVRAELVPDGGTRRSASAVMQTAGEKYSIRIEVEGAEKLPDSEIEVRLEFDSWFVPAEQPEIHGLNTDTRRLVVRAPNYVHVVTRR